MTADNRIITVRIQDVFIVFPFNCHSTVLVQYWSSPRIHPSARLALSMFSIKRSTSGRFFLSVNLIWKLVRANDVQFVGHLRPLAIVSIPMAASGHC